MSGKGKRPVLSTEDWIRRFKVVFLVAVVLMLALIIMLFVMCRADMIETAGIQKMMEGSAGAAIEGGRL